MEVSLKMNERAILLILCKAAKKAASFLSVLVIITAVVLSALYAMHIKPYVVMTGSMEPAVPASSICFVNENIPLDSISVGEVISFRLGEDMLVTHRVTAIDNGEYTTKGDANNTEDAAPVTAENYIGKTVFVIPKIGIMMIFLHTQKGRAAAVAVIALMVIISFLPRNNNI